MNHKLVSTITAVLAVLTTLGALDLTGILPIIPGDHSATLTWITGGIATLITILRAIADLLDDGQINNSYPKK
jgi:hypothetical protein